MESDWTPSERELPPEHVPVYAMDSGGHVQTMTRTEGLWFIGDMYIYYTPKFWKHKED